MILKTILIGFAVLSVLAFFLLYACLVVGSRADDQMEEMARKLEK